MCQRCSLAALRESIAEAAEESPEHVRRQPYLSAGLEQSEDWGLSPYGAAYRVAAKGQAPDWAEGVAR